jgi:capsule polysaccharide export protein KpsE/RkpR
MKIKKQTLLWGVIVVLFVLALYLTFKAGDVTVAQSAAEATTLATKSAASASYGGMVGGC